MTFITKLVVIVVLPAHTSTTGNTARDRGGPEPARVLRSPARPRKLGRCNALHNSEPRGSPG
jgi:hypothetical protein